MIGSIFMNGSINISALNNEMKEMFAHKHEKRCEKIILLQQLE